MGERTAIHELPDAIDRELVPLVEPGRVLPLYVLGRASLILGLAGSAIESTKDVDVVDDASDLLALVLSLFGKGQPLALGADMYVESLQPDFPRIPGGYRQRAVAIEGAWKVLRPHRLDWNDLAISKLKRFLPRDRQDLALLADLGHLDAEVLPARFDKGYAGHYKSGDPEDEAARDNLERLIDYLDGRIDRL